MIKFSFVFGLLMVVQLGCVIQGQPPGTKAFNSTNGRQFIFVTGDGLEKSFTQAEHACLKFGGNLAQFLDQADLDFLNNWLINGKIPGIPPPPPSGTPPGPTPFIYAGCFYTGPKDGSLSGPGAFQWIPSGNDVAIWSPGEPQKLTQVPSWDEDCCCVFRVGERWGMGDISCVAQRKYICQRSISS